MGNKSEEQPFKVILQQATPLQLFSGMVIAVVVSLGFYFISSDLADDLEKDLRQAFDQQKLTMVNIASSRVGFHIDNDVAANVRLLGQFPAMQRTEADNSTRDMEKVNTFAAMLVDGFVLFKANGDYLSSYPKQMRYLYEGNHRGKDYFDEPVHKEKLYFSDWIQQGGDKLKIRVSNPIYNTIIDKNFPDPTNTLSAVIMAQVDFDRSVVSSVSSLNHSGLMHWIVDEKSGDVLYHSVLPRQQLQQSQASDLSRLANALLSAFTSTVLASGVHRTDIEGKTYTVVSSRTQVGQHNLMVNLAYDDAEISLLVREKTGRIYLLAIAFLLMVIIAAVMILRQMVRRQALAAQTEQLESELALREEKKQLSEQLFQLQKMESLGELAAGMAHELNNALSEPMAMISLMQLDSEMSDDVRRDMLDNSMKSMKQARSIVEGLLRFSRSEKNDKQFDDLNADIHSVLDMHHKDLDIAGIQLTLSLQKNLPMVNAAHRQIQQVLLNLINNAKYAMNGSGKLLISSRLEMRSEVQGVAICVLDTGSGMDSETQTRIFEPFYSTKPVGEGTGLGLSICYGIVKDHGGELSVQSEVGEGSEFTVWLPVEGRTET